MGHMTYQQAWKEVFGTRGYSVVVVFEEGETPGYQATIPALSHEVLKAEALDDVRRLAEHAVQRHLASHHRQGRFQDVHFEEMTWKSQPAE